MMSNTRHRTVASVLALALASVTVFAGASVGSADSMVAVSVAYIGLTVVSILRPAVLVAQLFVGVGLCVRAVGGLSNVEVGTVAPLLMCVVLAAEVTAAAGRGLGPVVRDPWPDIMRGTVAAAVAGVVFAVVGLAGQAAGPAGLAGTAIAAGGCAVGALAIAAAARS